MATEILTPRVDARTTPETGSPVFDHYLEAIRRPDLKGKLTPKTPMVDFTMEVYLQDQGVVGGGGLGMVKGDTALEVAESQIPFVIFTLFYPQRMRQRLDENFYQQDILTEPVSPAELGFEYVTGTSIFANGETVPVSVFKVPDLPVYTLYNPNNSYVYPGGNHIDHRIFQQSILGFGGIKAMENMGIDPASIQVDEATAVFAELAQLDAICEEVGDFDKAKAQLKEKTLETNHTLVPAAIATFTREQFENYVIPNIKTSQVKNWLREFIDSEGGKLNLTPLVLELSGKLNGVSKIHAESASQGDFRHRDGSIAKYEPVTNGVFFEKWVPNHRRLYRNRWILDKHNLPTQNYKDAISGLDPNTLREEKEAAKRAFREYLPARIDQYGLEIQIPEEAKIAVWTKRVADYKRPGMLFEDADRLGAILEEGNVHVFLSGKTHPTDGDMKVVLQNILKKVDAHPILRDRVHFVQDYDEGFAKALIPAIDICFNSPEVLKGGKRVNTEADGTFWKKAMAGNAILISTRDGGVADVESDAYLEIKGSTYEEELESLYSNFEQATSEIDDVEVWGARVKAELTDYMPTLSAARMMKDYINLQLPKAS